MTKKAIALLLITEFLGLLALLNSKNFSSNMGEFSLLYLVFAGLGILGPVVYLFGREIGRIAIMIFYCLQSFFIYAEDFRVVFHTGIAPKIQLFSFNMESPQSISELHGVSINILAILLLLASYYWLKKRHQEPEPDA